MQPSFPFWLVFVFIFRGAYFLSCINRWLLDLLFVTCFSFRLLPVFRYQIFSFAVFPFTSIRTLPRSILSVLAIIASWAEILYRVTLIYCQQSSCCNLLWRLAYVRGWSFTKCWMDNGRVFFVQKVTGLCPSRLFIVEAVTALFRSLLLVFLLSYVFRNNSFFWGQVKILTANEWYYLSLFLSIDLIVI